MTRAALIVGLILAAAGAIAIPLIVFYNRLVNLCIYEEGPEANCAPRYIFYTVVFIILGVIGIFLIIKNWGTRNVTKKPRRRQKTPEELRRKRVGRAKDQEGFAWIGIVISGLGIVLFLIALIFAFIYLGKCEEGDPNAILMGILVIFLFFMEGSSWWGLVHCIGIAREARATIKDEG